MSCTIITANYALNSEFNAKHYVNAQCFDADRLVNLKRFFYHRLLIDRDQNLHFPLL